MHDFVYMICTILTVDAILLSTSPGYRTGDIFDEEDDIKWNLLLGEIPEGMF